VRLVCKRNSKVLAYAISLLCFVIIDSAFADDLPTVTLGGFSSFEVGHTRQQYFTESGPFSRATHFRDYNLIDVKVAAETASGLKYGAFLQLEANETPDDHNYGKNADKTYGFFEGSGGRLEFGANTDAAQAMKVDASTFAVGAGGIDGDWELYVGGLGIDQNNEAAFIIKPSLPTAHAETTKVPNANKITYYSPRIEGFQAGVSFTPDQGDIGTSTGWDTGGQPGFYQNVFNGGLNYNAKVKDISFIGAVTGEFGRNSLHNTIEDLNAYNAGINIGYKEFTIGGSYGTWNLSTLVRPEVFTTSPNYKDSYYWDIGAVYDTGNFATSLTYLKSNYRGTHELDHISLGADYKLAPGFTPFAEANYFHITSGETFNEHGNVLIAGTKLNF